MSSRQLDAVLEVLQLPPAGRSDQQLDALGAYFKNTKFFRAVGSDAERAHECIKHLTLEQFEENQPVFLAGDEGDRFYFVLAGSVRIVSNASMVGTLEAGASFGEIAVLGRTAEEQKRNATVIAEEPGTKLAALSRAHYLQASGGFAGGGQQLLKTPAQHRSAADCDLLMSQFEETDFFGSLHFSILQRRCCQCMTTAHFRRGEKLKINSQHRYLCIIVSGGMTKTKDGKTMRTLKENDTFNGEHVNAEGGVLTGSADGVLAVLSKQNYTALTSEAVAQIKKILSRPPQKRSRKELEFSIDMFCDGWKTLPFFR